MIFRNLLALVVLSCLTLCGCGSSDPEEKSPALEEKEESRAADQPATSIYWTEIKVHEAIRSRNPGYTGNGQFNIDPQGQVIAVALDNCNVADLAPLVGMRPQALYLLNCPVVNIASVGEMPLVELYLEATAVEDISPLSGIGTLQKLYLSNTPVSDLSPLQGLPIVELNLVNTHVKDISPLAGMPLKMLWLTGCPVEDISPLANSPLISLTLHQSRVADLSPLAGTGLQRLHIGETPVTDLRPLAGMNLTRLVFDRKRIEHGIEVVQSMRSLREIGSKFEDGANDLVHPAVYWSEFGRE